MIEKFPDKTPRLRYENDGISFELTPENTSVYLFGEEPEYDHVYYGSDGNYSYMFRQTIDDFDDTVDKMDYLGFDVYEEDRPTENDRAVYRAIFCKTELRELSDREENQVKFAKWLLENGRDGLLE